MLADHRVSTLDIRVGINLPAIGLNPASYQTSRNAVRRAVGLYHYVDEKGGPSSVFVSGRCGM